MVCGSAFGSLEGTTAVIVRVASLIIVALATALSGGCAAGIAASSADQFTAFLSSLILEPDVPCEQLRAALGLDKFPIPTTPDEVGIAYEETYVVSADGSRLRTWYLPADPERGVVIESIGSAGELSCYLYSAGLLVGNGWSVVLYEYGGFGDSSGKASLARLTPDLNAVLDWTLARTRRQQVTLYGISIGSIPSVAVAAQRPESVNGVVLDSPVAFRAQAGRAGPLAPLANPLLDLIDDDIVTDDMIGRIHAPLLVYMGTADVLTPPASVQSLFDRAPEPKTLATFEGMPHGAGQFYATSQYIFRFDAFLSALPNEAPQTELSGGVKLEAR